MFNVFYLLLLFFMLLYGGYETTYPLPADAVENIDVPLEAPVDPTTAAPPAPPISIEPALGEPFDLHLNDQATVTGEGLQIQFTGIQKDSRCPLDIMCAWSGVVGLEFTATAPDGTTQSSVLGGYADLQGKVNPVMETGTAPLMWLDGYTITIERVLPYPAHHDQAIAPKAYVATLVVTKDEQENSDQATPARTP